MIHNSFWSSSPLLWWSSKIKIFQLFVLLKLPHIFCGLKILPTLSVGEKFLQSDSSNCCWIIFRSFSRGWNRADFRLMTIGETMLIHGETVNLRIFPIFQGQNSTIFHFGLRKHGPFLGGRKQHAAPRLSRCLWSHPGSARQLGWAYTTM